MTAGQYFKSQILGTLFRREQASKVQQEQKMIFRIKNSYSQKKNHQEFNTTQRFLGDSQRGFDIIIRLEIKHTM